MDAFMDAFMGTGLMGTTVGGRGEVVDVDDSADSGAVPLVLLHGWTGSLEDFTDIVGPLSQHRRIIVPDLPGHGTCPPPAGSDYGLDAHVRWVLALLDDLGVGDMHLLGHSHGGLVAQRLAYLAAHRLTSLTLVGTGLGAVGHTTRGFVEDVVTTVQKQGMQAAWSVVEHAGARTPPEQAQHQPRRDFERNRFLSMHPGAVVGVARNLITATPLGAFTYGIDFPVLVCHGETDTAWLPHEQRLLAGRIPGSTYAVISEAQHTPTVENPSGMLQVLAPFITAQDTATDSDGKRR